MSINKWAAAVGIIVAMALAWDAVSTRGGRPGVKRTLVKAHALAERLASKARATGNCPAASALDEGDVDAWKRPFVISCEESQPLRVVITSSGADGMLGTIDDIRSESDAAEQGVAPDGRSPSAPARR